MPLSSSDLADRWLADRASPSSGLPEKINAAPSVVLTALEKIVATRGLTTPEAMQARKLAWRLAYLATPHGHPVDLAAAEDIASNHSHDGDRDRAHQHQHNLLPQRTPIAVSPARSVR